MTAWDISSAVYLQKFSVLTEDTFPRGVFFKPDGTKMYVIGLFGDDVNEYDLSTPWDISTASFLQLFYVRPQDDQPTSVFFKPDGTKMYISGATGDDINEYDLGVAWDVTSAVYSQRFYVGSQETNPNGVFFKPDGTKMYVIGYNSDNVNEYDLSTPWDISTASYLQNFWVGEEETIPIGVFFKPDGTKMYFTGNVGDGVYEYDLSVAWDVTSAVYSQRFSIATQDPTPVGVFFKPDGTKMYVVGTANDNVNEYDLPLERFLDITGITAPESAVEGELVNFTIHTQNIATILGDFKVELSGDAIGSQEFSLEANATKDVDFSFTMPNHDVTITVTTYHWE